MKLHLRAFTIAGSSFWAVTVLFIGIINATLGKMSGLMELLSQMYYGFSPTPAGKTSSNPI